ncbi:hypothetical protein D3C76_876400 [compost metagenome]
MIASSASKKITNEGPLCIESETTIIDQPKYKPIIMGTLYNIIQSLKRILYLRRMIKPFILQLTRTLNNEPIPHMMDFRTNILIPHQILAEIKATRILI